MCAEAKAQLFSYWQSRYQAENARLEALNQGRPDIVEAAMEEWVAANPEPATLVKDMADHIDHIVKVAGIDHVGIGCDFDGGGGIEGIFDASEVMNITIELVERGYTEEQIGKIWSGNLIRVFKEVQTVASEIQAAG